MKVGEPLRPVGKVLDCAWYNVEGSTGPQISMIVRDGVWTRMFLHEVRWEIQGILVEISRERGSA